MEVTIADALLSLRPLPGLAVLMCGVAGSGKTTFAMALEDAGFLRLSIDEEVWRRHGQYGRDFTADDYPALLEPVRAWLRTQVGEAVRGGQAVVIDSSFWSRAHRDEFKAAVESAGGPFAATPPSCAARYRSSTRCWPASCAASSRRSARARRP